MDTVKCLTYGFRTEFDGIPVLEPSTGEMRKGNPFYHGFRMYELKEYAVIESTGIKARIGDYSGPVGVRLYRKTSTLIEEAFSGE